MNDKPALTVVLPSYAEAGNLSLLLPRLVTTLSNMNIPFEILVIDTNLPLDNTKEICEKFPVQYINRTPLNSFGDAVRTGISRSQGEFVLFMDADGSHDPEFIASMWKARAANTVVAASRYVSGGKTENSLSLILMSKVLNVIYSLVLGLKCKDVSNSFKLYPGDKLRSLSLSSQHFEIIEEILFKLHRRYSIGFSELPFVFRKRMFGETKRNLIVFMCTYLITLLKLRFSAQ